MDEVKLPYWWPWDRDVFSRRAQLYWRKWYLSVDHMYVDEHDFDSWLLCVGPLQFEWQRVR